MATDTYDIESKPASDPRYTVGTLSYNRKSLFQLFAWLLWGDFCFMLMETIVPAILPLKLKHLDSPNWVMALIVSTLPGVLNMTVCPWISFKSDRHRGPYGRRIPFILWTLPPLSVFLVLLGFSDHIGAIVYRLFPAHSSITPATTTIVCIGAFMVGFQFFNMFVGSVFWYLFNDVVPHAFIGRFLGLFRIVIGIKTAVFNFFIFKYAESHMTEIFAGTAALYAIGFGLMCIKVKEGQYPPPPKNVDGGSGFISQFKTYATECYGHAYYWKMFLYTTCGAVSTTISVFNVFFNRSIGLDLEEIGYVAGIVSVSNILLTYPAGILADRYHPLRVMIWVQRVRLLLLPLGLIWLFADFTPRTAFNVMLGLSMLNLPVQTIIGALAMPLDMAIFPKDRFGQFCSAQSMVRSAGMILGGLLAGVTMDWTCSWYANSEYGYRYYPVWEMFWMLMSYISLTLLYKDWRKLRENTAT